MFGAGVCMRRVRIVFVAVSVWVAAAAASAQAPGAAPLYRIFLRDGTSVVSYGEFARVGDRVVFSLPLGDSGGQPNLHLASLPADRVDWPATERYREDARATSYAAARGEEDFAVMSAGVARLLSDIAHTDDLGRKLALAEAARTQLAAWPQDHFGYKGDEVRQILVLVDEVVSEIRAARGERRFDLNLVAGVTSPPRAPLLPAPSLQESIEQALGLSTLAESSADRVSLLQSVGALLEREGASLPASWVAARRTEVARSLGVEYRLDHEYAKLRDVSLQAARRAAGRADVRTVAKVIRRARERDRVLGAQRGDVMTGLLATLDTELDAARRLRLARDQWMLVSSAVGTWRAAVSPSVKALDGARSTLDDIRALAGSGDARLASLEERFSSLATSLQGAAVPDRAREAHAVIVSALQLATNAVRLRRTAARTGELKTAWDASAAAAGALLLHDRARTELARAVAPPSTQ